jgi:hypothetical protein
LPGISSLAIAPTTNPMIKVHRIPIFPPRWAEDIPVVRHGHL